VVVGTGPPRAVDASWQAVTALDAAGAQIASGLAAACGARSAAVAAELTWPLAAASLVRFCDRAVRPPDLACADLRRAVKLVRTGGWRAAGTRAIARRRRARSDRPTGPDGWSGDGGSRLGSGGS